jgi:GMP synthase (glutamine-hydrolysing)
MKTLLIDNGSTLTEKLAQLSPGQETIVSYSNIPDDLSTYSLIILSGSSLFPVQGNEEKLLKEVELIKNTKIPIVGVCFGHELIACTFGAKLTQMNQHVGMTQITVNSPHPMFLTKDTFMVYENHQFGVTEASNELEVLASSEHAIAVLKHKTKPIYGLQFHPEHHTEQQFGDEVFLRLFDELVQPE